MGIWQAVRAFSQIIIISISLCFIAVAGKASELDNEVTRGFFSDQPQNLKLEATNAEPPALGVYENGKLSGYIFSSYEISGSLGFSGKPIDIQVGVSVDGRIVGARLVKHQEPILILGIPSGALDKFVSGFAGFNIKTKLVTGEKIPGLPDAVSGASVSSGVIRDAIIRSARNVASAYNMFGKQSGSKGKLDRISFSHRTWAQLVKDGSIAHRKITLAEMRNSFGKTAGDNGDGAFISYYTALLTPPTIGQNLLQRVGYNDLISKSEIGDTHVLIAANGLYSFRGRSWRKSGVFDRIEIVQEDRTLRLTKDGYNLIGSLHAAGAPELREIAMYTLPAISGFDPLKPWRLNILVTQDDGTGVEQLRRFSLNYQLPVKYKVGAPVPEAKTLLENSSQLWVEFWVTQKLKIAGVLIMLTVLTGILFFQDYVARNKKLYLIIRLGFLLTTLLFLGFYAGAQLSVLNVLTFIHSLMGGFRWELFLLNPMVFILWGFVAVAMLFWGRGVYCGWLCPFGALQELVNKIARFFKIRQIEFSWSLHERLWPIKYISFLAILGVSLSSMTWAFRLAELEPFKTAIILKFAREWQYVFYALLLLGAGLFIERFYCRYLCPLGAALAIPARLRMFEWLNRRHQCGRECRICNTTCTVQAINPLGQISPNECVYCLRCQVNYYDNTTCRPLVDRARRRGRAQAAKATTEITFNAR